MRWCGDRRPAAGFRSHASACGYEFAVRFLPCEAREISFLGQARSSDQDGVGYVSMAFGHVHVAIRWVCENDRGSVSARADSFTPVPQVMRTLPSGLKLDDRRSFGRSREFLELIRTRRSRVCHQMIAVAIDMNAMRPATCRRRSSGSPYRTRRNGDRRSSWYPHNRDGAGSLDPLPILFCVAIDGNAIGPPPRSSVDVRPIPDHAIGIRAGIDGGTLSVFRVPPALQDRVRSS